MKRYIPFLIILIGLIAGPTAMTIPLGASLQKAATTTTATSQQYFNKSSQHKLIIRSGSEESASDAAAYTALLNKGAIVREIDYGSFKLIVADEQILGGRDQLLALGVNVYDEMDLISINGHTLDTTDKEVRQSSAAEAVTRRAASKDGLYIVQFIGPIKDQWLEELEGAGTKIVSYAGGNAYVVRADATAAALLAEFNTQDLAVQFVGDYRPEYRLSPGLQAISQSKDASLIDVTVKVVDGPDTESVFNELASTGKLGKVFESSGIHTARLRVAKSRLTEIANFDSVLFIGERSIENPTSVDDTALRMSRKQLRKMGQTKPSAAMIRAYRAYVDSNLSDTPSGDGSGFIFKDQSYNLNRTGQTFQMSGSVESATKPLRISLAWSDAAGLMSKANRVNDLDLEVTINGATYRGNIFSGVESVRGGVADNRSDVESVYLPAGVSGSFTVTVRASNLAGDGVSGNADRTDQNFALVVSNATANLSAAAPTITVNPTAVSMTATVGGVAATKTITLQSNSNWTFDSATRPSWLTVTPSSGGSGSHTITLRASPASLCPFIYFATIRFDKVACCESAEVDIDFTVTGTAACVSTSNLNFTSPDGANPAPQSFSITNCAGGALNWTATDDASWLSISPASGTAPSNMTVSVNVAGLNTGTYTGRITITPAAGCARVVTVTLNMSRPAITVSPTSLNFVATTTGPNPANQTLNVGNLDAGVMSWSVTDNASWLSVSPASGSVAAGSQSPITVSVNKTGLAAGNYSATVTITAPTSPNSPKTIPVSLSVTSSATLSVNPTSLSFTKNLASGFTPAPKTVTISISAGSANWTASESASWMSLSPTSGTASFNAPSTLTVSVNHAGLDVGTYTANITITAPGQTPKTIPVTFNIIEVDVKPSLRKR